MTKKRALIILGLLVALVPFLGFPREVRETVTVLSGLIIAALAFLLKRKLAAEEAAAQRKDTFTQNGIGREEHHFHDVSGSITGTD